MSESRFTHDPYSFAGWSEVAEGHSAHCATPSSSSSSSSNSCSSTSTSRPGGVVDERPSCISETSSFTTSTAQSFTSRRSSQATISLPNNNAREAIQPPMSPACNPPVCRSPGDGYHALSPGKPPALNPLAHTAPYFYQPPPVYTTPHTPIKSPIPQSPNGSIHSPVCSPTAYYGPPFYAFPAIDQLAAFQHLSIGGPSAFMAPSTPIKTPTRPCTSSSSSASPLSSSASTFTKTKPSPQTPNTTGSHCATPSSRPPPLVKPRPCPLLKAEALASRSGEAEVHDNDEDDEDESGCTFEIESGSAVALFSLPTSPSRLSPISDRTALSGPQSLGLISPSASSILSGSMGGDSHGQGRLQKFPFHRPELFPFAHDAVCNHYSKWKRTRSRKGINHMVCMKCGSKWRSDENAPMPAQDT